MIPDATDWDSFVCLSVCLSVCPSRHHLLGRQACVCVSSAGPPLSRCLFNRKKEKTPEKDIYVDSEGPRPLAVRVFPPRLFSQKSIVVFRKSKNKAKKRELIWKEKKEASK
jgi:hypothetical protein